jgi:hypothetical protein
MNSNAVLKVVALMLAASVSASGWFDAAAPSRLAAGKTQLDVLLSSGSGPAQGTTCWRNAVDGLEDGCKGLNDERQSRLAVAFTNCHLAKSGLRTYACVESDPIHKCTADMATEHNGMPFGVYTTFYTHAESMCFYLQSAAFQERTELAVSSLHSAVNTATDAQLAQAEEQTRLTAQLGALRVEEASRFDETTGRLVGLSNLASVSVDEMSARPRDPAR